LGKIEGYEETAKIFDIMEDAIGYERTAVFHSHFSMIEYSQGGEKRHLTFDQEEFGPDFAPIARLVCERRYTPVFICESAGTQSIDALEMKRQFLEECEKIL
jgi:deoxyribonuclease-4